jgi:myo-inositol 2-dehydrogenase/D-chiro-inositol 1-dehydrogenase
VGVKIGVIGVGMIGQYLVQTIKTSIPRADVVAVSDVIAREDAPRLTHAGALDLISDPEVEAVIVASPDATHEEYVLACLKAQKPVLCEKPLAPTAAACHRIVKAETAIGQRLVQVGYMRRFDPAYAALKVALDTRVAGEPLLLHCSHRSPGPSKNPSFDTILSNAAVHDIDAARWLLGEEIVRATVYLPRLSRGPLGPLVIVLGTESGVIIDLEVFVNARYGYEIGVEVMCEFGAVSLVTPTLVQLRYEGLIGSRVPLDPLTRFAAAYRQELESWVQVVNGGQPGGSSAWDGYAATSVAEACIESMSTGQPADVRLDMRAPLYA